MICNSIRNCKGGDYCKDCSHAINSGQGVDSKGKMWRWEFNKRFGPLFLRVDGEPLKRQPVKGDHPAWEPFTAWWKERS